jgi:ribonuclease J
MIDRIGNPPIYTQYLTSLMIKKRQEEFPHLPALDLKVMEPGASVSVTRNGSAPVLVKTFPVTHSIPDSMGLSIVTKHGNIVVSGDLKLEHDDGVPSEREQRVWGGLGKDKNIIFIADSTNAEKGGFSIPESKVYATLEEIIATVKGRLVIGLIASNFERMIRIIQAAEKNGRKVVLEGRSVRNNIDIADRAKLYTAGKGTIIEAQHIGDYPSDRIVIICTGAQGEDAAALMRIATKKHKYITFNERDTVVLSSSIIPGNELGVQKLKDNLLRHGLGIVHYRSSDVHSTGHGNTGELVWMREQVKPNFFMPAYGFHSMLRNHAAAQIVSGYPKERVIIPDNGTVIEITNGIELNIHKEKVPSGPMMVDGFAIGDMQEVVIRDRQALAKDGMFVIIATVNLRTGTLKKSPDIISRGFVYLRESQTMLSEARLLVKKSIEDVTVGMNPVDLELVKTSLTDNVERYLFQKTSKRPMVIPVLIGV